MGISDHYRGGITERLLVQILTVDTTHQRIEGVGKDAAVIQIGVGKPPPLFVWPQQGEYWTIVRENGEWILQNKLTGPNEQVAAAPGEAMVQAEKIWTPSGDYLALGSAVDAIEALSRSFTLASQGSVSLGAVSGQTITGVRVTGHGVTNSTGGNTFIRLKPNGLAAVSAAAISQRVHWNGTAMNTDTVLGANIADAAGLVIANTDWGTNNNTVSFQGMLFTKSGTRRHYQGIYTNQDAQSDANNYLSGRVFATWNDLGTEISSLTWAMDAGVFTGRISLEIIP